MPGARGLPYIDRPTDREQGGATLHHRRLCTRWRRGQIGRPCALRWLRRLTTANVLVAVNQAERGRLGVRGSQRLGPAASWVRSSSVRRRCACAPARRPRAADTPRPVRCVDRARGVAGSRPASAEDGVAHLRGGATEPPAEGEQIPKVGRDGVAARLLRGGQEDDPGGHCPSGTDQPGDFG
jgi:hypothetical protein